MIVEYKELRTTIHIMRMKSMKNRLTTVKNSKHMRVVYVARAHEQDSVFTLLHNSDALKYRLYSLCVSESREHLTAHCIQYFLLLKNVAPLLKIQ